MDNPYHSPRSDIDIPNENLVNEIIIYWENKRLLYNAVLLVVGISVIVLGELYQLIHPIDLTIAILFFGVGANLCYTLGPYLNVIGAAKFNRASVWKVFFHIGLIGSVLFTIFIGLVFTWFRPVF